MFFVVILKPFVLPSCKHLVNLQWAKMKHEAFVDCKHWLLKYNHEKQLTPNNQKCNAKIAKCHNGLGVMDLEVPKMLPCYYWMFLNIQLVYYCEIKINCNFHLTLPLLKYLHLLMLSLNNFFFKLTNICNKVALENNCLNIHIKTIHNIITPKK